MSGRLLFTVEAALNLPPPSTEDQQVLLPKHGSLNWKVTKMLFAQEEDKSLTREARADQGQSKKVSAASQTYRWP